MKKFSRGLWIPDDIIADDRLTAGQKMMLAMLRLKRVRLEEIAAHLKVGIRAVYYAQKKFKELGLLEEQK